jgi:uncharacterized protein YjbI with pentapeptide repeats
MYLVVAEKPRKLWGIYAELEDAESAARAYGARIVERDERTLTRSALEEEDACEEGLELFDELADGGEELDIVWDLENYLILESRLPGSAAWLAQHLLGPCEVWELPGQLAGVDLRGLDLNDNRAVSRDLSCTVLPAMHDVDLRSSKLIGACFTRFGLETHARLTLVRANLRAARISHVSIEKCDFTEASCVGGYFEKAKLHDCVLDRVDFRACDFSATQVNSVVRACDFRGANLRGARFAKRVFHCDFRGADLDGTMFAGGVVGCQGWRGNEQAG